MTIPILNLYYLLCYAWNLLEERGTVNVSQADPKSMEELFTRILETSMTHILKRGLDRAYVEEAVDTSCLRGKLDVSTTLKSNLLVRAQVHCVVDEFSHDIVHNQIIKTTIGKLIRCLNLERSIRDRLVRIHRHLGEVSETVLDKNVFDRAVLHRNNAQYRLPLEVCRLIHDRQLIEERGGHATFRDFLRDEKGMATVFEKFVLNFYRREQSEFESTSQRLEWQETKAMGDAARYLPSMLTDISLKSANRTIIVDTKYYRDLFSRRYDSPKVRTENLYQLYAYLQNVHRKSGIRPEGILLYPTTSEAIDLEYLIHGYRVRIVTVDLNDDWRRIHQFLIGLVAGVS